MPKLNNIVFNGIVTDAYPNALFKVKLENDHSLVCHLAGKMRVNNIRVYVGDKVSVEVDGIDLSKGRITFREKGVVVNPSSGKNQ